MATRLLLVIVLLVGCGSESDGPARYPISGTVTYDGKPVPKGTVSLEPDGSKGNVGPAIVAEIRDGKYQSESEMGTVGGPHLVRINGLDGQPTKLPDGMEMPDGKSMFPDYTTTVDLPKEATTHNFEVPATK